MKRLLFVLIIWLGVTCLLPAYAQQIKVISFNIRPNDSQREDGKNAWVYRQNAVLAMISKEMPDVMGLQGVLRDQMEVIDQKFVHQYRHLGISAGNGRGRGQFTTIYYNPNKLDLIGFYTRWLSESPYRSSRSWDAKENQIVTYAHFRVKQTKKEFYYFNTRLDSHGEKSRQESIKLIAKWIKDSVPENGVVILGGDMQTTMDSHIFDTLYSIGMKMARTEAPQTDYYNSYNGFGSENGAILDHFFIKGVPVKRFSTLNRSYSKKTRYISNHYPIKIILNLQ